MITKILRMIKEEMKGEGEGGWIKNQDYQSGRK